MGTVQEKKALVRLIQENLVHLCKTNAIYGGQFDLDGIICISGQREGQELVVKLHERFGSNPTTPTKFPPQKHDPTDTENNNRHFDHLYKAGYQAAQQSLFTTNSSTYHPLNDIEPEMLDLRMNNANRHTDARSDLSKQSDSAYSSPAKRWRADGTATSFDSSKTSDLTGAELDRSYSTATSPSVDDQAENLSMSAATSEDGSASITASPDKGQYLGKAPYLASPYHLQKKTPLKQERWTPSTPLPTIPECRQCGFTFENFEVLSEHNEAVHSVFTCPHCHKTFTSRSNLERHSRLHTGFKPYVCAICSKAFSRKDHLSNHSAKHAFKCGNCNKRYADKQSLAQHFTYEHESMLTNTCEFCNKGFSSLESCEEHVKTHPQFQAVQKAYQHKGPGESMPPQQQQPMKKYNCEACKFVAPDRISLIKHRLLHIDGQRCYTCLSCAKVFTDPLQYDEHMLTHDGQINIYECCICRQIFPTLDVLHRHEVIHVNEDLSDLMSSALPCPHCDKVLRSMPELQQHIMQHAQSLAKKHKCLYCNMGFSSYAELCRHMDELRHYPPDPRMLFGLTMQHQPFGAFEAARKFSDLFTQNHKNSTTAARDLMFGADRFGSSKHNDKKTPLIPGVMSRQMSTEENTQKQPECNGQSKAPRENNDQPKINGDVNHEMHNNTENENRKSPQNDDVDDGNDLNNDTNDLDNDIGSDIEVVEPEAPEDDGSASEVRPESFSADFNVSENKSDAIEVAENNKENVDSPAIQNQPVKSMLCNKNSNNSVDVDGIKEEEKMDVTNSDESKIPRDDEPIAPIPKPVENEFILTNGLDSSAPIVPNKDRARKRKGPSPEKYVDDGEPVDMSMSEYYDNYDMDSLASENSNSAHAFDGGYNPHHSYAGHLPSLLNVSNILPSEAKLQLQIRSERKREVSRITPNKMSVDIPPGPTTCSICQTPMANFQALEQHCFAEHNRCPCMFCPKTFAQKANRDRHVCLHTGDKPYECPECGDRFSRGDKLKLHRVRTHNIPTNPTGYGSGSSKRETLTPGRDWVIPSPSTTHSEAEGWSLAREDGGALIHGGGEWMVQENTAF